STVAARRCVPPRSAAKIRRRFSISLAVITSTKSFTQRRKGGSASREAFFVPLRLSLRLCVKPSVTLPHNLRCLQISSLLNVHRQPNKLGHGPRQRRRRSGSAAAPLPHLLGNHQS